MSNVLVIHPSDRSTDFLKKVYEGKGYDVINDCRISDFDLLYEIIHHDKIIMMGHGTPGGLINPEYFNRNLLKSGKPKFFTEVPILTFSLSIAKKSNKYFSSLLLIIIFNIIANIISRINFRKINNVFELNNFKSSLNVYIAENSIKQLKKHIFIIIFLKRKFDINSLGRLNKKVK